MRLKQESAHEGKLCANSKKVRMRVNCALEARKCAIRVNCALKARKCAVRVNCALEARKCAIRVNCALIRTEKFSLCTG